MNIFPKFHMIGASQFVSKNRPPNDTTIKKSKTLYKEKQPSNLHYKNVPFD